jgi:hypothetical protein
MKITVIVRFVGTSKQSTKIRMLYASIINQINFLNNAVDDELDELTDLHAIESLRTLLQNQLCAISTQQRPNELFLIVLDSIDQLKKADLNLDWMLFDLPKNIKIVYSTLKANEFILERIKTKLVYSDANYLELRNLYVPKSLEILKFLLNQSNRQITDKQYESVKKCLNETNEIYPLHLKLLYDLTVKWHSSYEIEREFYNCTSIKNTIKYIFRRLERKHGKLLFSKCVFYLTIFKNGISENEFEDILSVDDEVLQAVYVKSEQNLKRFPYILWLRIKYDLKDYLVVKESGNLNVITW